MMNSPISIKCWNIETSVNNIPNFELFQQFKISISKLEVEILGEIDHEFENGGFTGLLLLAESHAAIHTWPENNYIWVELATCGDPKDLFRLEGLINEWPFVENVNAESEQNNG